MLFVLCIVTGVLKISASLPPRPFGPPPNLRLDSTRQTRVVQGDSLVQIEPVTTSAPPSLSHAFTAEVGGCFDRLTILCPDISIESSASSVSDDSEAFLNDSDPEDEFKAINPHRFLTRPPTPPRPRDSENDSSDSETTVVETDSTGKQFQRTDCICCCVSRVSFFFARGLHFPVGL